MNNLNRDEIIILLDDAISRSEESLSMSDYYYWKGRADGYQFVLYMIDNEDTYFKTYVRLHTLSNRNVL